MQKMPSAQLVRDAVYAVATALDNMHRKICRSTPGVCEDMAVALKTELRDYLYEGKFYGKIPCLYCLVLSIIFKYLICYLK